MFFRLEQLKTYGENEWKKRVKSTNDADEFTVEGKLRQAGMLFTLNAKDLSSLYISGKALTPTEEQKPLPTSTRKTRTLKYGAKKSDANQEQHRAKTVDVVRLKAGEYCDRSFRHFPTMTVRRQKRNMLTSFLSSFFALCLPFAVCA